MLIFVCCFSESLVDVNIEESVANMQSVIELGRLARDRRAIPTKVSLLHQYAWHNNNLRYLNLLNLILV